MRILVIDDESAVADLLAEAVRRQGHDAIVAKSGRSGLTVMEHAPPDAVFLDVVMPEMSGVEVLRRIRARHPSLPVVLITAHSDTEEVAEAERLGVSEVIRKPEVLANVAGAFAALERSEKP